MQPLTARSSASARAAARQAGGRPPRRPRSSRDEAAQAYIEAGEQEGIIEGDERRLIQSIVDFGDTLVREVMTPRPDIVAIRAEATLGELRALLREQDYSRIPVFSESLDNVARRRLREGPDPACRGRDDRALGQR